MPVTTGKTLMKKAIQVINNEAESKSKRQEELKKIQLPSKVLQKLFMHEARILAMTRRSPRRTPQKVQVQKERVDIVRQTMLEQLEWN